MLPGTLKEFLLARPQMFVVENSKNPLDARWGFSVIWPVPEPPARNPPGVSQPVTPLQPPPGLPQPLPQPPASKPPGVSQAVTPPQQPPVIPPQQPEIPQPAKAPTQHPPLPHKSPPLCMAPQSPPPGIPQQEAGMPQQIKQPPAAGMQAPNVPARNGVPPPPWEQPGDDERLLAKLRAHAEQRDMERMPRGTGTMLHAMFQEQAPPAGAQHSPPVAQAPGPRRVWFQEQQGDHAPPAGAALQVSPHSPLVAQAPGPTNTPPQAPAADQSGITTLPRTPGPQVLAALRDDRRLRQGEGRAPRAGVDLQVSPPSLVEQAPGPGHQPPQAPAAEPPPGGPQAQALAKPVVAAPDTTTVPNGNFLHMLD